MPFYVAGSMIVRKQVVDGERCLRCDDTHPTSIARRSDRSRPRDIWRPTDGSEPIERPGWPDDGFYPIYSHNICAPKTRRGRRSTWRRTCIRGQHGWGHQMLPDQTVQKRWVITFVSGTNSAHARCPSIRCMLSSPTPPRPDQIGAWELLDMIKML
jgi:hypothetical protein